MQCHQCPREHTISYYQSTCGYTFIKSDPLARHLMDIVIDTRLYPIQQTSDNAWSKVQEFAIMLAADSESTVPSEE